MAMTLGGAERQDVSGRALRARAAGRRWTASVGVAVLVADEDRSAEPATTRALATSGVNVTWCSSGADALVQYGMQQPDAVLVSPRLGDVDAATVVRTVRSYDSVPILLGVGPDDAEVAGPVLVAGASGAVARPYDAEEILLRLTAQLPDIDSRSRLAFGPLELDPRAYSVRVDGLELADLPLKEFELLRLLVMHADQVVSAEQIRSALWGETANPPSSNAIAVHAARLRHRLRGALALRTVRGRGYRLTLPD